MGSSMAITTPANVECIPERYIQCHVTIESINEKTCLLFTEIEKAQILPIVAIGMFAMIGMAALLLDSGVLMANRRSAQAAADAGALAGARLICLEQSESAIEAEALYYAVDLNKA